MSHVIERALGILKKDGAAIFGRRLFDYAHSYLRFRLLPQSDPKNTNWHRYIKELDTRSEIMNASPWKLSIASTSICNQQCIMCTHVFSHPRAGAHFHMSMMDKLESFICTAGEFQLMGTGEPLISPAFWRIMGHIQERHRTPPVISISSNAAAMTPHIAGKLLGSPLREVSFSLDAATPETYKKIRNSDFEKTISYIRHFLAERSRKNSSSPSVMLNMTLMRENIEELPMFIDLAHELGVNAVQFWPLHDYASTRTGHWRVERSGWLFDYHQQMLGHDAAGAEYANAIIDRAIGRAQELAVPIIWPVGGRTRIVAPSMMDLQHTGAGKAAVSHGPSATHPLRECVAPWEWMLIDERGNVRPCCYVEQSFGNLHQTSPEAIWNGPDYREMRRDLARDILPPQCRNAACKFARGRWIYT